MTWLQSTEKRSTTTDFATLLRPFAIGTSKVLCRSVARTPTSLFRLWFLGLTVLHEVIEIVFSNDELASTVAQVRRFELT